MKHLQLIFFSLALMVAAAIAAPTTKPSAEGIEYFEKHIRPVLVERCYRCHSKDAEKVKGGLLLDTRDGLLKGGENGVVIVPGDPEKSKLIIAIRYHDEEIRMPPKEPLAEQQIAHFVEWVKMGAPDPRTADALAKAPPPPPYDYAKAKLFWSFKPVRDPQVPAVRDSHW
ncbi:MAG TPA: c-type cytochrome domain-containing protein, partial [Tepidisphaeraceae bacterium]|nr:c-type cytochrome domain-containing protein [Tepidisphaeraceae bacterium]